jgi:hypothetical protein
LAEWEQFGKRRNKEEERKKERKNERKALTLTGPLMEGPTLGGLLGRRIGLPGQGAEIDSLAPQAKAASLQALA